MSVPRVGFRAAASAAGLVGCVLLGACAPMLDGGAASGSPSATVHVPHDWRDATYRMTCDGLAPGGFRVTLVNGAARVLADAGQTPYYEYFDVHFEGDATGDVDGDGRPDTVVLLQCSPQPSNGFVEEAQVFDSSGRLMGILPSPSTLPEATILPPLYDSTGLRVDDGDIVAAMKAYGPNDSHATGPSVPITVRWHWDGKGFERIT